MDKEGVSVHEFDIVIRGLLAVPKEAIQRTMEKTIAEKKRRSKQELTKKKR